MTYVVLKNASNVVGRVLEKRAVISIAGKDAEKFLQGLTTNDVSKMPNGNQGDSTHGASLLYTGILTNKGRMITDAFVSKHDDNGETSFMLDVSKRTKKALMKHLKKYKLRSKVAIKDISDEVHVIEGNPTATSHIPVSLPKRLDAAIEQNKALADSGTIPVDPRGEAFGSRAHVRSEQAEVQDGTDSKTVRRKTRQTQEFVRTLLGSLDGKEYDGKIPHESNVDLLHGIHFQKGCYLGQELTARTQFKGNVRKRVVPCLLIASDNQALAGLESAELAFPTLDDLPKDVLELIDQANQAYSIEHVEQPEDDGSDTGEDDSLVGESIISLASGKRAGVIQALPKIKDDMGNPMEVPTVATAMMRLEHLIGSKAAKANDKSKGFSVKNRKDLRVMPIQPSWWPTLDSKTGKPVTEEE